jgi:hypothetical protein
MRSVPVGIRLILAMALVSVILLLGALDACTIVPVSSGTSLAAGATTGSGSGSGGAGASSVSSASATGSTTSSSSSGLGGAVVCGPAPVPAGGGTCTAPSVCTPICDAGTTCTPTGCGDWAEWKMPNPPDSGLLPPASYSADAGVVVDNVTNLTWQQTLADTGTCSGGCEYMEAGSNYCATLTLGGASWRLPTRIELVSLQDYTQPSGAPLIDPVNFPNTPLACFWTSTQGAGYPPGYTWFVDFQTGVNQPPTADSQSCYVRCVH